MGALAVRRDGTEAPARRPVLIVRIDAADADADGRRAASSGGFPELLRQLLPVGGDERFEAGPPQLSKREYEVLRMLADGESARGIAERLSYSERTVKGIVHDLLAKLNCRTRAHAVALAARQGVI
jgi:DNA-binding CsgD family transcriptional regulator